MKKIRVSDVLSAGLIAGTLDGIAAALVYVIRTGKNPLNVYRYVASGVFGQDALSGGVTMAMMGILFHYTIATSWALIFFVLCSRNSILLKNWLLSGIAYGIVVWLLMNLVILPLSRVSSAPMTVDSVIIGATVIMGCVGLPIAFMANKSFMK